MSLLFYGPVVEVATLEAQVPNDVRTALAAVRDEFSRLVDWTPDAIGAAIDTILKARGIKLGKLAPALRLVVFGQTQTPAINQVLALAGRDRVLARLAHFATA